MRKLFLALIVLFATSFIYVGCSPDKIDEYDTKALDKDEVKEDDI